MPWLMIIQESRKQKQWIEEGVTLYSALAAAGIWAGGDCGGAGTCGKCRVQASGAVSPPGLREKEILASDLLAEGWRLACLTRVQGDCTVEVEAAPDQVAKDGPGGGSAYVAVDLGTTSIAAGLVDDRGRVIASVGADNPQKVYGRDVVSRLAYSLQSDENRLLMKQLAINGINRLLRELEANQAQIICLVGNPVMIHLLLGVEASGLAAYPYQGTIEGALTLSAGECGLETSGETELYLPPAAGKYVGSDALAGVLDLPGTDDLLFIDLGTNGELLLRHQGRWWAASAAAGPAFEGASISCGMRAAPGAIVGCRWNSDDLELAVIGDQAPRGICGSGLVQLMAALRERGVIDRHGVIASHSTANLVVEEGHQGRQVILYQGERRRVVLTQEDIRQFQLAKSAVRVAVDTLLTVSGAPGVKQVYLAGAFGSVLPREALTWLGVLPAWPGVPILAAGNTALAGAARLAADRQKRRWLEETASTVQVIELADQPDFQEAFLKNLGF